MSFMLNIPYATCISIVLFNTIGLSFFISTLLVLTPNVHARNQLPTTNENSFIQEVSKGNEKVVKLEVYLHDFYAGNPNQSVFTVATSSITATSPTAFGRVNVIDDLLTVAPEVNSTTVGKLQGTTASTDMNVMGLTLNLNFVFTAGRFNGSTISIFGRNPLFNAQRELAIVGGTGSFRFARGYAIQTSVSFDTASASAVLKFTIYTTVNSKFGEDDAVAVSMI